MRDIRGKEIALIFQEPMTSLSAHYTVGNQIGEAILVHDPKADRSAARVRTLELLRLVGIPRPERRIDEYPFQLSGGLRQRVMIAMALACDPRILIADEPTTALDVTTQAQVLDLLRSLQRERGLSVILITHDMGVIAEMADDVAVMYLGRIVERGPVDADIPRATPSLHAGVAALDPIHPGEAALEARDHRGLHSRIPTSGRKAARSIRAAARRSRACATSTCRNCSTSTTQRRSAASCINRSAAAVEERP